MLASDWSGVHARVRGGAPGRGAPAGGGVRPGGGGRHADLLLLVPRGQAAQGMQVLGKYSSTFFQFFPFQTNVGQPGWL